MGSTTYFNVFMVEEFETASGETARNWTKVGVAFPHTDDPGFNLEIKAFPRDGKLIALPPNAAERGTGDRRDTDARAQPNGVDPHRTAKAPVPRDRSR